MAADPAEHVFLCPACGTRSLVDHCGSKVCRWHKCLAGNCGLVADLARGTGHRISSDGVRVAWHTTV
jgi:hypothetical protein